MRNVQMLIVSVVKICKQCLQTASASGDFVPRLQTGWAIASLLFTATDYDTVILTYVHSAYSLLFVNDANKQLSVIITRESGCGYRLALSVSLSVCLCICPVRALTFESLDLETPFLVFRYIFTISRSNSYVKVIE